MRLDRNMSVPSLETAEPGARTFLIAGQRVVAARAAPGLHLVATPIGHLGDITLRALETLAGADLIACEDTRITHRLLERYGISARLKPYHEHNATQMRPKLLEILGQGGSVALVSDAGTPLISDPGYKLVREAYAAGHQVISLPGPSAVLAALSLAGLPTDRFFYDGFLPSKQGARRTRLTELAAIDATLVLFEAGSRIQNSVRDLAELLGATREAAICRELTKLHQEVRRASLAELAAQAGEMETRGEFVVVIAPPDPAARVMNDDALDRWLSEALTRHSVKDAVAQAVDLSGRHKRDIYARALKLSQRREADDGEH
ncbi:16S rRNA (cytidine1402-2'-O)-methyltransferase [Rhodopseudomonas thermotolerans]|uniref:Ribosomal RNA small subunit methyltransferase I n=3 Tax=Nitrobacteraceae TaxID=41294 RepID=A0A336JWS5_9BRAD|nr:16S rRNA (cytidine1402-2'-O)-methyltransferase [Rhodopseudomonas pentothenatexigens]REF86841.1 16S rRNA (cytidine1402-2'-O)-methyltransferase [Rhodopseudomonas thermotolerans]SSW93758.1 16S rRNA (cytidine1402-2'-O)-methyltransferase [Rhodopseudomonas pentothenatexigens]